MIVIAHLKVVRFVHPVHEVAVLFIFPQKISFGERL